MRYAMIMAGGAGTRLWPMSRRGTPKQLIPFIRRPGDTRPRSLLELSAARLEGLIPQDQRFICTAEEYRDSVRRALPEFTDERILGEPAGRDTLNAVGLAAAVFQKLDPDAIFAVFTADHIIEPIPDFQAAIDLGYRMVEADPSRLVTFSITPTYPATAFGYVERGMPLADVENGMGVAFKVARFVEKPDLPRATAYVQSGVFGWNSGMFVWKASTVLDAVRRYKPETFEGLKAIQDAWGTDQQRAVLERVYPTLQRISVDYALMEHATRDRERPYTVCTVMTDVRWLDVGSWPSYAQTLDPDEDENRTTGEGAVLVGSRGNLVVNAAPGHTVALLGCDDLVVVHTPDATLVMPREKADELKVLHGQVPDSLK